MSDRYASIGDARQALVLERGLAKAPQRADHVLALITNEHQTGEVPRLDLERAMNSRLRPSCMALSADSGA